MKQFKSGDESAFEAVYMGSFGRIKSGLNYMLQNESLAEDMTQEAMIKIYRNIGSLEDPAKYMSWANTIAANTAKDYLKKGMASEVTFSALDSENDEGETVDFEDSLESEKEFEQPEKAYDRKETERLVREIIDELPEGQRIAITMFYYDDMKVKEIARLTGNNENAVNQALYQAKKKIEKKVRELEKQGVKLYSLTPFTFFLWLFKSIGTAGTAGAVAAGTATAAGAAAVISAATSGTAAAGTAGGFAAWIVGIPAAVKIIAAVLGAAVIAGGTGLAIHSLNKTSPETAIVSEDTTESETERITEAETESVTETAEESSSESEEESISGEETAEEESRTETPETQTPTASLTEPAEESTAPYTVSYVSLGDGTHYYFTESGERVEESCLDHLEVFWVKEPTETEWGTRGWRCGCCGWEDEMKEAVPPIGQSVQDEKEANGFRLTLHVYSADSTLTEDDAYDMTVVTISVYTVTDGAEYPAIMWRSGDTATFTVPDRSGVTKELLVPGEGGVIYYVRVEPGTSGYSWSGGVLSVTGSKGGNGTLEIALEP